MNQEKIGKFISELRKEKGLTQEQLAEILHVSNKSVSKWENARCMPDLSLFEPICKEFNITITELLNGERLNEKEKIDKIDKSFVDIISLIIKPVKVILKFLIITLAFLIFLLIIYILIEGYNSKKVYLKDDKYDVTILCRTDGIFDDHILVDLKSRDGYNIFVDTVTLDDEIYIKAYTEKRDYKHKKRINNSPGIQMLIDIKKNKDYKLYKNSELLYDSILNIEKCTD